GGEAFRLCSLLLLHPLHPDFLDVLERLAIHRAFRGLPRDSIRVNHGDRVGCGYTLTVGKDGGRFDNPFITVVIPRGLAKAAVRVKSPRTDLFLLWVPADPLSSAGNGDVVERGRETGNDEVLILGPFKGNAGDFAFLPFIRPITDGPFQSFE